MSVQCIASTHTAWNTAFERFKTAHAEYEDPDVARDCESRGGSFDRCRNAEAQLLSLSAPNVEAIIEKLMILWPDVKHAVTQEGHQQRMVIGDLRGVQRRSGRR